MGLSRRSLDRYRKGEIGKDRLGICHTLEIMETAIESHLEKGMTDGSVPVQAALARLRTMDRDRWSDSQKIDIDVKQQISISLDPDSALAKRLNGAGVTIDQPLDALEKPV